MAISYRWNHTIYSPPFHSLVDDRYFHFRLLWITLLWTFMHKFHFISLQYVSRTGISGSYINLLRKCQLFSKWQHQHCVKVLSISPHPCQHLQLSVFLLWPSCWYEGVSLCGFDLHFSPLCYFIRSSRQSYQERTDSYLVHKATVDWRGRVTDSRSKS